MLSPKAAIALGLSLENAPDEALSEAFRGVPYIRIKYFNVDGKDTGFYRLRALGEPTGGFAVKKPQRYFQRQGTQSQAYFPKTTQWQSIMQDATKTVVITEGELKAACASVNGIPCIGLGGVYSWRSAARALDMLPELRAFPFKGRDVVLLFDSDSSTNHQVAQALKHLANELTLLGAVPRIGKLPGNGKDKVGLDDFVVAKGLIALQRIIEEAEPFAQASALWEMNERVCFVRDPGIVIELATSMRMNPGPFVREVYATESYVERVESEKGFKLVKKRTADEWMKWPHRRECSQITYRPGEPPLTEHGEFNTWRGPDLRPRKGDITPWKELLWHLFDNDLQALQWFERWCAYPLQNPGTKMLTAPVLWGVHQGTGKSLSGYTLAKLYGERNVSEVTQDHLRSSFNDWLVDKQLILGEEITGSDRRADADRLKTLITQRLIRVNLKYVREYQVPAVANFFFTSNHPDAFFLEDTDRRYFIWEIKRPPLKREFYDKYSAWYKSQEGQEALLHYILAMDLGDFEPNAPAPVTQAKIDMAEDNKSDLGSWVLRLKKDAPSVLAEAGMPPGVTMLTTTQLLSMYDPQQVRRVTTNGLGRELKRAMFQRFRSVPVKTNKGRTTYCIYAVQGKWDDASVTDVAREWENFFGDQR